MGIATPALSRPRPLRSASPVRGRTLGDRRRGPALTHHAFFGGRRVAARRVGEEWGTIPDQHGVLLFLAVTGVAMLNILDAFYTVLFLSHGGTELNPFVDWVLRETGVWGFIAVKSVGIGLCVAFLTVTKNFMASRIGLSLVLLGYTALLGWHFHLTAYIP